MAKHTRRTGLGAIASIVGLIGLTVNAWGGGLCLRPRVTAARQTAGIQQQLMVAALTCHQTGLYNRLVTSRRNELRRSDAELRRFFEHRHGGIAAYHAYKTHLANAASLRSLHNIRRYCRAAETMFEAADKRADLSLAALAFTLPSGLAIEDRACPPERRVAGRGPG